MKKTRAATKTTIKKTDNKNLPLKEEVPKMKKEKKIVPELKSTKNNKSTTKSKNWRKNIDITFEETKRINDLQKNMENKQIENMKESDLFTYDVSKRDLPKGFLKRKIDRSVVEQELIRGRRNKGYNKLINMEVKRREGTDDHVKNNILPGKKVETKYVNMSDLKMVDDFWGENINQTTNTNTANSISLPKINLPKYGLAKLNAPKAALPHPGLSYNPNIEDSKNLINSLAELNKGLLISNKVTRDLNTLLGKDITDEIKEKPVTRSSRKNKKVEKEKEEEEEESADESDSDSETDDEDTENENENEEKIVEKKKDRLTKTQRNKKILAKFNKVKNRQQRIEKQNKIEINNLKNARNFLRIQNENHEKQEKDKVDVMNEVRKRQKLISLGVYLDKDTEVNLPKNTNLRNLNRDSYVREKFESILKTGLIGEFSLESKKNDRYNVKRNKLTVRQKRGLNESGIYVDQKEDGLKIYD